MMNMLCLVVAHGDSGIFIVFFLIYRALSHYIFMILISIFAAVDFESFSVPSYDHRHRITFGSDLGLFLFVWAWTAGIISHVSFYFVMNRMGADGAKETTRNIVTLLRYRQIAEAEQLYLFGIPLSDNSARVESIFANPYLQIGYRNN